MKNWLIAFMGACAAAAFVVCTQATFATVPLAGSVRLTETSWGGSGRLWLLVGCACAGLLAALTLRRGPWAVLFPAIGLGLLLDMGISGWDWRAEKLEELRGLGLQSLASGIQYGLGLTALAVGAGFLLAQLLLALASRGSAGPIPPKKEP